MDIESARHIALGLGPVTEDLFSEQWISFRIAGKWFMLMQLDAPEPRIAVKLPPETGTVLRDKYDGVKPAYHMNKQHWNDLYFDSDIPDDIICDLIKTAYDTVVSKLTKKARKDLGI